MSGSETRREPPEWVRARRGGGKAGPLVVAFIGIALQGMLLVSCGWLQMLLQPVIPGASPWWMALGLTFSAACIGGVICGSLWWRTGQLPPGPMQFLYAALPVCALAAVVLPVVSFGTSLEKSDYGLLDYAVLMGAAAVAAGIGGVVAGRRLLGQRLVGHGNG